MSKKITIPVDVKSDSVDDATEAFVRLQTQIKLADKELQQFIETGDSDKIIGARNKVNDLKDELERTKFQSKDLHDQLAMVPGPLGDIVGSANQTISVLRSMKGITFKDISVSVAGFADDVKDAGTQLLRLTGLSVAHDKVTRTLVGSMTRLGVSMRTSAVAARALSAAIIATGIGALVVLLVEATKQMYELATGEKEAAAATARLNAEIDSQNRLLEVNQKSAENRRKVAIADMRLAGKTESDIRKFQTKEAYKDYEEAHAAELETRNRFNKEIAKANAEDTKRLTEELRKREQATKDAYANYLTTGKEGRLTDLKEQKDAADKLAALGKASSDKAAAQFKADQLEIAKAREEAYLITLEQQDKEVLLSAKKWDKEIALARKYKQNTIDLENAKGIEISAINAKFSKQRLEEIRKSAEEARDAYEKGLDAKKEARDKANKEELEGIKDFYDSQYNDALKAVDTKLQILGIEAELVIRNSKQYWKTRQDLLNAAEAKELIEAEQNEVLKTAIVAKYAKKRTELTKEEKNAQLLQVADIAQAVGSLSSALASMYDTEADKSEKAFETRKKFLKAEAIMNAAAGVVRIWAVQGVNPILAGLTTAVLVATTAVQIAKINSAKFGGGDTSVSSGGSSGRVTGQYSPELLAPQIGGTATNPNVQLAGMIGNQMSSNQQPIKAYVLANEIKTANQFDRRIAAASKLG